MLSKLNDLTMKELSRIQAEARAKETNRFQERPCEWCGELHLMRRGQRYHAVECRNAANVAAREAYVSALEKENARLANRVGTLERLLVAHGGQVPLE
jgi:hypothetical protein